MGKLVFTNRAWEEYLYWQVQDRKTLKRINSLLKDIDRDSFEGIGKPEPLKNHEGFWSRRIDCCNRLVYKYLMGIRKSYNAKDIMTIESMTIEL